jgi:hypothetical protein
MNSIQIASLFFNCLISVGSSVLLLYVDIGIHRDIKELNVLFASIFSTVNFYTIYSSFNCDELGYSKDYKAALEEPPSDDDIPSTQDFHSIWTSYESNRLDMPSLYDEDLYEEKI